MKLAFYTIIYGDEYWFNLFEKFLIPSLLQPGNLPALNRMGVDIEYYIYSLERFSDRVAEVIRKTGLDQHATLRFRFGQPEDESSIAFQNSMGVSALIDQAKVGLRDDRRSILCAPDFVYGNGSIFNQVNLRCQPGTCLGSTLVRCLDTALCERIETVGFPISQRELVTAALRTLHVDLLDARVELGARNSYYTGASLQSLGDCLYTQTTRTPTVAVADFVESDLRFFEFHKDFRSFDRDWPGKLINEGRFKLVGGSDVSFLAEMTPAKKGGKNPRVLAGDDYVGTGVHNHLCRSFMFTLRSSEPVDLDEVARSRGLSYADRLAS